MTGYILFLITLAGAAIIAALALAGWHGTIIALIFIAVLIFVLWPVEVSK